MTISAAQRENEEGNYIQQVNKANNLLDNLPGEWKSLTGNEFWFHSDLLVDFA